MLCAGPAGCDALICYAEADSALLAAWLQQELAASGLRTVAQAGLERPDQAVQSCRVCVVLLSSGFLLSWPAATLSTVLERANRADASQPAAPAVLLAFVDWTRSRAEAALRSAGSGSADAQARLQLQQLVSHQRAQTFQLQQHQAPQLVQALIGEALCAVPRRYENPTGKTCTFCSLGSPVHVAITEPGVCAGMVGEDRLVAALHQHLLQAPAGCVGLWGMRGLGKTTLARALCAALQDAHRTCLLELPSLEQAVQSARQADSEQQMQALLQALVETALRQLGVRPRTGVSALQARP